MTHYGSNSAESRFHGTDPDTLSRGEDPADLTDEERVEELHAVLRDLKMGAEMMLQLADIGLEKRDGAFMKFAAEVKRVTAAGIKGTS